MLWAVVMAGGSGTRFWPESRTSRPKQFLTMVGRMTLIESTCERLRGLVPPSRLLVVTQASKRKLVQNLLHLPPSQILGEPVGKNTAPCAILAAAMIQRKDPDAVLVLLPADNWVGRPAIYRRALKTAYGLARLKSWPVTFGIRPNRPHTGYGYLELGRRFRHPGTTPVFQLKRFCEKPSLAQAKAYLKSEKFLWNGGIFVWRSDALLEAAGRYLPEAHRLARDIVRSKRLGKMESLFPRMPNISIDYALMEKLRGRILTLAVDFGWSDLGGWEGVSEFWPRDRARNAFHGTVLCVKSEDNRVKAGRRLVVLLGVKGLTVIDAEDALLVASTEASESVREVVRILKEKKLRRYI